MRNLKGKVVMITGASSGIGKACAIAFAKEGCDLVICARRQKELDEVASEIKAMGRDVLTVTADVAKEEDIKKVAEAAFKKFGKVDIAMSNAGIAMPAQTHLLEKADWERVMNTNFYGCVHVIRYFLPPMAKRKEGHLIVNSSAWGLMGGPFNALYVTSKHALIGLSETIRAEMKRHNVGVTTLAGGYVKTEIFTKAEMKGFKDDTSGNINKFIDKLPGPTPESFAKKVVRAVKWNRGLRVLTVDAKVMWWFKRAFPATFEMFLGIFARFSTKFLDKE
ncbi:MAG: SDR family NAD(P)-dependent oxidoreductase [Spirochaetes bacterium]|jgi:NADP-dependent 3-hydroxy acid dehydrogenase YdfG|nr:SDR family NAD(P)-dependent oxidoreductase [Spirochaetota bacterium]